MKLKGYKNLYIHDASTGIIIPIIMASCEEEGDSLYIKVLRKNNLITI